ncbi:SGNH hydrolase domain-containing protein [Mesorhizobium sp. M0684]|uniref:SGNH hydrolase domain-containing protein n=1 Tax=Mesorhizobium sp. M0684 TaxID=2956986 RepID=UPI00333D4D5B
MRSRDPKTWSEGSSALGDSHAMSLSHALAGALSCVGHGLRELSVGRCPPFVGSYRSDREDECATYNKLVQEYLVASAELKTVVVVARWTLYFDGNRFNKGGRFGTRQARSLSSHGTGTGVQ